MSPVRSAAEWGGRHEVRARAKVVAFAPSTNDLKARGYWNDYQAAYADMLHRCSTEHCPWHIVPANHKWYRDYVVGTVEYRFEALFFVYLHLRWTGAFVDHLAGREDGSVHYVRQMGHSLSAAVSSGFAFESSIYVEYAFSTAQLRGRDGHAGLVMLTKAF